MRSPKVLPVLTLAAVLVACGGGKEKEAPARGGGSSAVSKATDDIPTSNRKDMYVDRFRFGDVTDADGIVTHEVDQIPAGSTAAMSFYVHNAPAGTQVRIVWKDLDSNAEASEPVKSIGSKGLVAFQLPKPLAEGSYRLDMFYRPPEAKQWQTLGTHPFKVGKKI